MPSPQYKFINDEISSDSSSIEIDSLFTTKDGTMTFNLNHEVCYFAIEAYPPSGTAFTPSSGNISKDSSSGAPCNLFIQARFDTCAEYLQLKWNSLNVWNAFEISYNYKPITFWIPWSFDGAPTVTSNSFDIMKDILHNSKYFTDTDVYFRVVALDQDFNPWNSNIIKANTHATLGPSYVNADGTDASSNDSIKLNFTIDPASKLNKYRLLRAVKDTSNFTVLGLNNCRYNILTFCSLYR